MIQQSGMNVCLWRDKCSKKEYSELNTPFSQTLFHFVIKII